MVLAATHVGAYFVAEQLLKLLTIHTQQHFSKADLDYPVFYDVDHVGLLIWAQHILIQLQPCTRKPTLG